MTFFDWQVDISEGLKTATGAIASAANSAVGTVGGYIVRAGSSAVGDEVAVLGVMERKGAAVVSYRACERR